MSRVASEVLEALQRRYPQAAVEAQPDGGVAVVDRDGLAARYRIVSPDALEQVERTARILRSGILRSLPRSVASGAIEVVSTASRGDVLLALDAPRLSESNIDAASIRQILGALARMHAVFAGFPARLTSSLGLLPLGQWLSLDRPTEESSGAVVDGWRRCAERIGGSWAQIDALLARPAPLVEALRDCQPTIVVGNIVPTELSVEDERVVLHDWTLATRGPGALDLGLFVAAASGQSPLSIAECVEVYRVERAAAGRLPADGERWERELALGLLAGFLRCGWQLSADADTLAEWQIIVSNACDAIG
ncbi:MAG: hypothetical protein M9890_04470 [Thermomicrobiales bacterium]|nr:hypothetical protein [Thermomicrobiales bacterium]